MLISQWKPYDFRMDIIPLQWQQRRRAKTMTAKYRDAIELNGLTLLWNSMTLPVIRFSLLLLLLFFSFLNIVIQLMTYKHTCSAQFIQFDSMNRCIEMHRWNVIPWLYNKITYLHTHAILVFPIFQRTRKPFSFSLSISKFENIWPS